MAFTDYKNMEEFAKKHGVTILNQSCLPAHLKAELPQWFLEDLEFALHVKSSEENEAFYEEFLIAPFLKEAWKKHQRLKVWSHTYLKYDEELSGTPDYLVSVTPAENAYEMLCHPLVAVAQAKREDFIGGWGQCLSAMAACQQINAADKTLDYPQIPIYGIVSTGELWQFAKLEGAVMSKHPLPASIAEPERVAGILDYLFAECEKYR